MKQLIQFAVSVLAISCLMIVSCKKNADDPSPPSIQSFSGTWIGTINVDDLNLCTWTGDPITVRQTWLVSPDSSVTINDTLLDHNSSIPWTQTWKGRLYNQDSLFVTQTSNVNCFGVNQTMTTQLKTKIIKTPDNKYTFTAKVDYPVCPPVCLFAFNYLVKKQD
ncbi:MAG TPA: hypothetical protein VFO37_02400 [Chitinophagaceae bacterium]|nr:hypothetical protein [Chitinophagaceae bacterium]